MSDVQQERYIEMNRESDVTQLTYPSGGIFGGGGYNPSLELVKKTDAERVVIAAQLESKAPLGARFVALPMPNGIDKGSKRYGNVRYTVQYYWTIDEKLGRMDVQFETGPTAKDVQALGHSLFGAKK